MSCLVAIVLAAAPLAAAPIAVADNPPAGAAVTARASARVVRGIAVRQAEAPADDGPSVQINRKPDGEVLVEFI